MKIKSVSIFLEIVRKAAYLNYSMLKVSSEVDLRKAGLKKMTTIYALIRDSLTATSLSLKTGKCFEILSRKGSHTTSYT